MAVDIHRYLDEVMPHLLLDVCWRLTVLKEPRGEGVPEVMKPDAAQPRFRQQLLEDSALEV